MSRLGNTRVPIQRDFALYFALYNVAEIVKPNRFKRDNINMALLNRYDTPAFLPDFNAIPGQLDAWHRAVSAWFDQVIANDQSAFGASPLQYYNAPNFDPGGMAVEQAITWNAFPKEMLRRYGRDRALVLADRLWPTERYGSPSPDPDDTAGTAGVLYRPQEEYCEWHVLRQPDSNKICRVTFSSEPPEYWQAMFGLVPGDPDQHFPGDQDALLRLYRDLVSPDVQLDDLIAAEDVVDTAGQVWALKGQYNSYNKWNTTLGIAHLNSPPNSLVAEIQLGADATVRYTDPRGRLLVEPDALIGYAGYGGSNRNSDPTIGASVNALARLGAYVTLRNPVGFYMDHIDLSGWEAPDKRPIADCVHIVRGVPQMVERMSIEVPASRGFDVGDLTIAGIPIRFGGQIAECITVKLVGIANILPKPISRPPVGNGSRPIVDPFYPRTVGGVSASQPVPPGFAEAYLNQGTVESAVFPEAAAARAKLAAAPGADRGKLSRHGKRRY